jgi:hypothetical protein
MVVDIGFVEGHRPTAWTLRSTRFSREAEAGRAEPRLLQVLAP